MAYIGKTPSQAVRQRYYYTASGSETSLSGADDNSKTLAFSDGEYVDVYLNGVSLVAGTDYNTNTANTIAGLSALAASDVVEIVVYDTFSVHSGTFNGPTTFTGDTTTTGDVTITGATAVTGSLAVDNISINGNLISSTNTNGDIDIDPAGTGNVLLGNFEFDVDQTVGSGQDNYVLTYDNSTGHISLEATAAAGAVGGGSDEIFYENGQNVTTNYTITNGKNAMSAGPITIDSGVTVTVGTGETWTVV